MHSNHTPLIMSLFKSFATVSAMTLVSRVLGFIRDTLIALTFGASMATDAFFVAFRLPNLLRRLFAEGAFSQAFVPILSEYKNTKTSRQTHALVNKIATLLFVVVSIVSVIGTIAAPIFIYVTAPGFTEDQTKFDMTVTMLRITFPYILFMSLVSLSGAILNSWNKFTIPALTPALLNISFIVCCVFFTAFFSPSILSLAWAVFIGGVLQLGIQIPALIKIGMLPIPDFSFKDPGVKRMLILMGPAVLGVSVSQLSIIINTILASFLQNGSVSWLYYADRLMEFPTGLLGVALGTVLLPHLSKTHATDNAEEYQHLLDWGLKLTLLLALPAAVGLSLASTPLIATLFLHGKFTPEDVAMTQNTLIAYSVGLPALIVIKVLAPAFYAKQNIRTPVKIAILSLAATQFFNLLFLHALQHVALALSISLAALLNASLLFHQLCKTRLYVPGAHWKSFLLKLGVSLLLMTLVGWLIRGSEYQWITMSFSERIWNLSLLIGVCAATYFGALHLSGVPIRTFLE